MVEKLHLPFEVLAGPLGVLGTCALGVALERAAADPGVGVAGVGALEGQVGEEDLRELVVAY